MARFREDEQGKTKQKLTVLPVVSGFNEEPTSQNVLLVFSLALSYQTGRKA